VLPPYPPDTRRLRKVVEVVAAEAGWDDKVKEYRKIRGRGLGIAAHRSFLSYAAMVIDVSLDEAGVLTIHEIHGAVDCGIAVNPDRVKAQIEGGIVYALSLALHGEITVKDGAVQQHNFDDYPVLRLYQTPKIVPHIVKYDLEQLLKDDPDDPRTRPTGIGEIPVPPVAPALANAIVAAGGPRIRALPVWRSVTVL
jgi:isoquinoline 1-oxidoreductase subunit beta